MLAASTGARRGELLDIRRKDLDLSRSMLSIERGIVRAGTKIWEHGTKTHQARAVSLDARTADVLRAHLSCQDDLTASVGAMFLSDGFIFTNSLDGSIPWRPESVSRSFHRLCIRCRVVDVRLHDLRHYVATSLLASSIDVRTVAGRLGHRNPSTTLNVYAHFVPGSDREASAALARLFEDAEVATTSSNESAQPRALSSHLTARFPRHGP
jgi:integrase